VGLKRSGQWLASEEWSFDKVPPGLAALFSCLPTMNRATVAAVVGAVGAAQAVGECLADLFPAAA
jgi:exonuclease SbcD